jgi:cytochrome c oxidase subunit 3
MADVMNDPEIHVVQPPPRRAPPLVPNAVLGTSIFVLTEAMLFAGFISAHTIAQANVPVWPPAGQPRLPIEATAINTVILLVSGAAMWWAGRRFESGGPDQARAPLAVAAGAGVVFVAFQGFEWVGLIREGLTLQSSAHAAFFYLIVGMHALHVCGGLAVLLRQALQLMRGALDAESFWAARLFWYFVVLLWPVLYWQVYL